MHHETPNALVGTGLPSYQERPQRICWRLNDGLARKHVEARVEHDWHARQREKHAQESSVSPWGGPSAHHGLQPGRAVSAVKNSRDGGAAVGRARGRQAHVPFVFLVRVLVITRV